MHLDLSTLRERHSRLPVSTAFEYLHRASLGLQRAGHEPDCAIALEIDVDSPSSGTVSWPRADLAGLAQLDRHRITEDTAEAVGLVLAHEAQRWAIVRRLQRFESADWLLDRLEDGRQETLALEISGVSEGPVAERLREKLEQVAACPLADRKAASVVGLAAPLAHLRAWEAGA